MTDTFVRFMWSESKRKRGKKANEKLNYDFDATFLRFVNSVNKFNDIFVNTFD